MKPETVVGWRRAVFVSTGVGDAACHPAAEWGGQQPREASPEAGPYRYVILDRDSKLDDDVLAFLKATRLEPNGTSVRAPGQNGAAERGAGSCRSKVLDHVIPLNEQHWRRLVRDYASYFHSDRIHDSLGKDTPNPGPGEQEATREGDCDFQCAPGWSA